MYRGLKRSAANWERLTFFAQKENLQLGSVATEVCKRLQEFFTTEVEDVISGGKPTSINCSVDTLNTFFNNVGLDRTKLPQGWETLPSLLKK